MAQLLELAVEAARQLSPEEPDEIARTILELVHGAGDEIYMLSEEQNGAIDRGLAELKQGEYVTLEQLRETLAKYRT